MITGDAEAVARSVAQQVGIDRYFAGVRPENKAAEVERLQREGRTVAMVGDGVNDAPALAMADVGIAIGAGTDVAIASAGVILAGDDPRSVLSIIDLSRAAYRKMRQNLWWAAGYNLIAVPLAAGVLGALASLWFGGSPLLRTDAGQRALQSAMDATAPEPPSGVKPARPGESMPPLRNRPLRSLRLLMRMVNGPKSSARKTSAMTAGISAS
jgi:hypothetical protein